jgi:dihydrofolate reductase
MNAIFGVNANNGFGIGNTMPWDRSKEDMVRFRKYTTNNIVLMGKNTWLSDMPKPLPNRRNTVLSNSLNDDRCEVYRDINSFLSSVEDTNKVWVIGGISVLWHMRPYITNIYLSEFHCSKNADVYIDTQEYLKGFELINKEFYTDHTFKIYKKI